MKVTKYEHACFTVEIDGKILIVDPGGFTKSLVIPDNVVAIVVTHAHPDHFDPDMLAGIYDKNHDSVLTALPEIVEKMPDHKSQPAGSRPPDACRVPLANALVQTQSPPPP